MIVWSQIRFYLQYQGGYACAKVGFRADHVHHGSLKAYLFCQGYTLGAGKTALLESVRDCKEGEGPFYMIPEDLDKLQNFLSTIGRRSA